MTEYISLGENCLPDDVLSFLGLKNESYPFGGGRFNIEYIHQAVVTDFEDLLNESFLVKGTTDAKEVVRNSKYTYKHDIYSETVTKGFEFTHHNVFEEAPRRSMRRKVERFKETLRSGHNIVFFYHYRYSSKSDVVLIEKLISEFLEMLRSKFGHDYKCLLVYQILSDTDRGVNTSNTSKIFRAGMVTREEWEGDDLWNGQPDRDLFSQLFHSSSFKKFVHGKYYYLEPMKNLMRKVSRKLKA